jgi:RNA polymerase II elongation factor ELL
VRPYEFAGLTDEERRKMWRQTRQFLYLLGIPETDSAWDPVRTQPGSTGAGSTKAAAGPKRAAGTVNAERKKNTGSSSKPLVEAKDEGVRPSQTTKVREDAMQAARSVKAVPMRDDNPPSRRPPGASGQKNVREVAPTQSQSQQAQGPSKKAGVTDARAKHGGSSKSNGRSGPTTHVPASSSHERELERERPTHPTKKEREDVNDLDREKGKAAAVHKEKRRKDDMSDLDSLRDWDGTDAMGKANAKRKKSREDYDDKDRINGTGNTVKRRKVLDDDKPYKPGGGGGGGTKARERDRDKELDRGKTRDRDSPHVAKRPRDSDWDSPDPPPPPRKSTIRERERQREREPDRSLSPPRRVKREYSLSPALLNSPLPRAIIKRADSPARHSVKREGSPRLRGHSRRDESPLAPQTSSKRAASPSRSQNRARERHRETSTNGVSTSRRRRSPIYTSSEDEQQNVPVRRNAPSSVTSSSSSRDAVRTQGHGSHPPPPTVPYPKDREGLEARYRSGYRNYIAVYYKLLDERAKIQDALEDVGREGSVGSDRDVEMMDEEGLRELKGQYTAWTRELEGIRNAYSAEAERMDKT